jgi:hypothetical protein
MALKLAFKTGNAAAPVWAASAATKAFAAQSGLIACIEGDGADAYGPGFIANGKWYDRLTGIGYTITGTLVGGAETRTSGSGVTRGAIVMDGTQTVDLGAVMPISSDTDPNYSIFAVYKQATSAIGILGSNLSGYHAFNLNSTGRINASINGASLYTSTVDHALGSVYRAGFIRVSGGAFTTQFNGSNEQTGTSASLNADSSAIVGDVPGLAGDRNFRGSIYHLSLWRGAKSGADLAAINAYLLEQYG